MDWRRRGKGEGGGDRQGAPSDNPGNAWEGILPASSRVVAPHPRLQTFRRSSVLLSDSWHELSEATLAPYPEDTSLWLCPSPRPSALHHRSCPEEHTGIASASRYSWGRGAPPFSPLPVLSPPTP